MIIKILGSMLVVCATAMMGFGYAAKLEKRKASLGGFLSALSMLETEIGFVSTPLKTAFLSISNAMDTSVGAFFKEVADNIGSNGDGIKHSWEKALDICTSAMTLTAADVEVLETFAVQLGKTDRENQLKNIAHTKALLNVQLTHAADACGKNKKMYQSAGILSGCLIAILLF